MRLRATGFIADTATEVGDLQSSITSSSNGAGFSHRLGGSLAGTVRMEAIVPNISFRAMPVLAMAMATSVLTKQLLSAQSCLFGRDNSSGSSNTPTMGYLTLNQTRYLVPLLETDAAQTLVPLVGLWVKISGALDDQYQQGDGKSEQQALRHPFVWGACVRFLCSEYASLRPTLEQNMFRLVSESPL